MQVNQADPADAHDFSLAATLLANAITAARSIPDCASNVRHVALLVICLRHSAPNELSKRAATGS